VTEDGCVGILTAGGKVLTLREAEEMEDWGEEALVETEERGDGAGS
jgi:hypothetical protein